MKYVIIGGGAAGIKAAEQIRSLEKDSKITIIMEDMNIHSRCMLHKYLSGERNIEEMSFLPKEMEEELNIEFFRGYTISSVDTDRKLVKIFPLKDQADDAKAKEEMEDVSYDKLLIATGSNGFIPPAPGLREAKNVHCFRHLREAEIIREKAKDSEDIAIIGAGLVGIDAAYGMLERGKKVTVIDMAVSIIPMQLCKKAGDMYQKLFEDDGCKFELGIKVSDTKMDSDGNITAIILDNGTEVKCDLVIAAAGERAAIKFLEGSSIKIDRFIEVDDHMRTSVKDVFAAGNATGLSGTWPNAKKQAEVAAYNMCGIDKIYDDTYAMKNTMNFYGLATLSLGSGKEEEGDRIIEQQDSFGYRKAIIRNGVLDSVVLQGKNLNYAGVYQHIIKNKINIEDIIKDDENKVFKLSFADFYDTDDRGQYVYA